MNVLTSRESAEAVAARQGGVVVPVQRKVDRREEYVTWYEVHSTPVESTVVEENPDVLKESREVPVAPPGHYVSQTGALVPTKRYCAPLRCYCQDPACTARKAATYTTDDLLATARQEAARLRREGVLVEEVPPEVRRRAARWMKQGAPAWTGVQPHLQRGCEPSSNTTLSEPLEMCGEPTGMTSSTRTRRRTVKRDDYLLAHR